MAYEAVRGPLPLGTTVLIEYTNVMLSEQFDNTPNPKKLPPFPSLERAEHWKNESAEWWKFIQSTGDSLTSREYSSAFAQMQLADKYAENNIKKFHNPFNRPTKRCKTCNAPMDKHL